MKIKRPKIGFRMKGTMERGFPEPETPTHENNKSPNRFSPSPTRFTKKNKNKNRFSKKNKSNPFKN
jgi:hypothetical protein